MNHALTKLKHLTIDFTEQVQADDQPGNEKFKKGKTKFELQFHRAHPVSDYIWENKSIKRSTGWIRRCVYWLIMLVFLGAFFLFSCFSSYQVTVTRYTQTPIGVDCTNFYRQEDGSLEQKAFIEYKEQAGQLKNMAKDVKKDVNALSSRSGYWVCFCKDEIYNNMNDPRKDYTLAYWRIDESGRF